MLKKTITFKDLDGNDVTEDFYFNLTKAELAELEMSKQGGLGDYLEKIIKAEDGKSIMDTFKQIIMMSVGKRSDDGRRFIKNQEIVDEFMQTDAYSVLFMELCTDAEAGGAFIKGVVPSDLATALDPGKRVSDIPLPEDTRPDWLKEGREPTDKELEGASQDELRIAFRMRSDRQLGHTPQSQ